MKVTFKNHHEIRMGSPYSICDLEIEGSWVPELPNEDWQDRTASSPDGRYVALVAWDTAGNNPGFKIYTVDTEQRSITKTKRIRGFCDRLRWDSEAVGFILE